MAETQASEHSSSSAEHAAKKAKIVDREGLASGPNYVQKCILGTHGKAVASLKFSVDGALLASASADASVNIYKTETQELSLTLSGHTQGISDVCWTADAQYVATASDDKLIKLWDLHTGRESATFEGHSNYVFCVNFNNPQTNLLVSGSFDQSVKIWDVRTGQCVRSLAAHSDPVTAAEFNRDGTTLVSGSHDGLIRIWDTSTGECLKTIFAEGNPPVSYVRFAPNGKFLLASTLDSTMRLWQTSNPSKCVKTYRGHHANEKYSLSSAFALAGPGGKYVAAGSEDRAVVLYDLQRRTLAQRLEGHTDTVLCVAAHPTRPLLASGGLTRDCTIRLWEDVPRTLPPSKSESQEEETRRKEEEEKNKDATLEEAEKSKKLNDTTTAYSDKDDNRKQSNG
eukprot:CAMPEP_0194679778 /NCGR_PEP_ID=MMETSP0295-20121207/11008_1 /TAXON_ID=39354 /ORGANISM="Heterosigma akashiwo, Strain CCMP2393" /LENGTH=396 /DNA_ID=CAMNT_0039565273 /DNA_START=142 /DNA_END=1332 /DNA_ORIENTATION=+